jgi:hypothetical protein
MKVCSPQQRQCSPAFAKPPGVSSNPGEPKVQTLTGVWIDTELLSPVKRFDWKFVQIWKFVPRMRFGVGGTEIHCLTDFVNGGQSTHPNATNVPRSKWKWIINLFDKVVHRDKVVKRQLFRQISATRKSCERTFRQDSTTWQRCENTAV